MAAPIVQPPDRSGPFQGERREAAEAGGLEAWLAGCGLFTLHIRPLPGDVSPRRYFRLGLTGSATAVLAVYPPDQPEQLDVCRRFLRTTELLADAGVRVPGVLAHACDRGWAVVEDLGDETLYDRAGRPWSELVPFYRSAVGAIRKISALPDPLVAELSPPLDRALLRRELAQTVDLVLEPRGLAGGTATAAELDSALDVLCANLAAAQPAPCHRDLMARNLVPLPGGEVGVLDHQDLRLGPPHYDLASLLNDSLFPPPGVEREVVAELLEGDEDWLSYRRAAAQRALKAAGTFAAFARRGSERHLGLIPPTLERALGHLELLPETAVVAGELAGRWRQSDLLD